MIAVIVSQKDKAGMTIRQQLVSRGFSPQEKEFEGSPVFAWKDAQLFTIESDTTHAERLDRKIAADVFIFATRHSSESGSPSLCCHVPGNWGLAEMGGESSRLCIAPPLLLKSAFLALQELSQGARDEVTLEVTHHGPFLEKPCMFIEVGSDEKRWTMKEPADRVAQALMKVIAASPVASKECVGQEKGTGQKVAVGLGGNHYCSTFNKITARTNIALSHICPKYSLSMLTPELLRQALDRSDMPASAVVLDWKGLGTEKQRICDLVKSMGCEILRSDKL